MEEVISFSELWQRFPCRPRQASPVDYFLDQNGHDWKKYIYMYSLIEKKYIYSFQNMESRYVLEISP